MKTVFALFCVLVVRPTAGAQEGNPLSKALQLLDRLRQQITDEGAAAKTEEAEHKEFCKDRAKELKWSIKEGKTQVASLEATIEDSKSSVQSLTAKLDEITTAIATADGELKKASAIRKEEKAAFDSEKAELKDMIDTLERAITVLSRQKGAAMLQVQDAAGLTAAFDALVQASSLSSADASKLVAMVQSSQQERDSDDDSELSAPDAQVYQSHSGGILDMLDDFLDKAKDNLRQAMQDENGSRHNYELLAQQYNNEMKNGNKDKDNAMKAKSASAEKQSAAEGDLAGSQKSLAGDESALHELTADCKTKAEEFSARAKARTEELGALSKAKEVLTETTGGAESHAYGMALLQTSTSSSAAHTLLKALRALARKHHDEAALTQLASRVATVIRSSDGSGDVFAKVKGLINSLITRLQEEAVQDATQKAWCDKETAESSAKKEEGEDNLEELTTKIDEKQANSKSLKTEVSALQKELSQLAAEQAERTKLRTEENEIFKKSQKDLNDGVDGVVTALQVLRDYYGGAGDDATGAGASTGIIGSLEVCESDFRRDISEIEEAETEAADEYQSRSKQIRIDSARKKQDVKYKQKEIASLDKSVSELSADKATEQQELDAVNEVLAQLHEKCVPKAESYEEKQAKRNAEIDGLKEALDILNNQASLLQTKHSLRGVRPHA